jgi:hypothetical protein
MSTKAKSVFKYHAEALPCTFIIKNVGTIGEE